MAENLDQMRLSLRHHMEEEERLTRERADMITRLSHDIRTPLTSMSLFAELLQKGRYKDKAQRNHYTERIHENAVLLTELTDQLQRYTVADEKHEKEVVGIGVNNIRKMVEGAGGRVFIRQKESHYEITLILPGVREADQTHELKVI